MRLKNLIVPFCMIVGVVLPVVIAIAWPEYGTWYKGWLPLWALGWAALGSATNKYFQKRQRDSYILRENLGQLIIKYRTESVKICRNGLTLNLVVTQEKYNSERMILVCDPGVTPSRYVLTNGDCLRKVTLSDGQVLNISRHSKGFMVWWDLDQPWQVVE